MTEYTEHALLVDTLRMCASEDRFCSFLCPYHRKREGYECLWAMMREAADVIEELLAAVPQWISVDERLPEQYEPVLVTYVGYNTNVLLSDMVAYRNYEGDWCWWDGSMPSGELCKVKISHWMPLPEPPKEENDNG